MLISEQLLDAKSLLLTANTTTFYTILYLDTKDGPLVLEIPSEVLGRMDDGWFLPPRPSRTQTGPSMDLDRVRRLFIVFLPFF